MEATVASAALYALVYWLIERVTPSGSRVRLFAAIGWLTFVALQVMRLTMYWSRYVNPMGGCQ